VKVRVEAGKIGGLSNNDLGLLKKRRAQAGAERIGDAKHSDPQIRKEKSKRKGTKERHGRLIGIVRGN